MLVQLTADELEEMIGRAVRAALSTPQRHTERGLPGVMAALHVGKTKAQLIKSAGVIDGAITQPAKGSAFYVDVDKCQELYHRWCETNRATHKPKTNQE